MDLSTPQEARSGLLIHESRLRTSPEWNEQISRSHFNLSPFLKCDLLR
jgi:hypothetical protein